MPSRAATFPNVTVYNPRPLAGRDYRRTVLGGAVLGLGSVSAVAVMAGTVAVASAWMVSGSLNANPDFRASAPFALEAVGLPRPPQRLAEPADMLGGALASANPAYALAPHREAELAPAVVAAPPSMPHPDLPASRPRRVADLAANVPLPAPRPQALARTEGRRDVALPPALVFAPPSTVDAEPLATIDARKSFADARTFAERARVVAPSRTETRRPERVASLAPTPHAPPLTTGSIGRVTRSVAPPLGSISSAGGARPAAPRIAYNNPETLPGRDSHTAFYDIVAHTVYMPDGERLEAHSGLGRMIDDPRYASQKGRGPTPPNTYDLTLRRGIFHGVQALRLNPVADSKMYGRDGILAHTYMLGPSGQSFGCVSFKHYGEFLAAFERGEVTRIVVVPHLPAPPPAVSARRENGRRYASNAAHDY